MPLPTSGPSRNVGQENKNIQMQNLMQELERLRADVKKLNEEKYQKHVIKKCCYLKCGNISWY